MQTEFSIANGSWVTSEQISGQGWEPVDAEAWFVQSVVAGRAQLSRFRITDQEGSLAAIEDATHISRETSHLTPIKLLVKSVKSKWITWEEVAGDAAQESRRMVWAGKKAMSQAEFLPDAWKWPSRVGLNGEGPSLLNFHSAWAYYELVRQCKQSERLPFASSWELHEARQHCSLNLMWFAPGVAPKTAVVAWRMAQRALPNADRRSGILELFEQDTCDHCEGQPRLKSEHLLFRCVKAKEVWDVVDTWLASHKEAGKRRIDEAAVLHGVDAGGPTDAPFRTEQWWAVLWTATLFEIWKSWSGCVYGVREVKTKEAMLCTIWLL